MDGLRQEGALAGQKMEPHKGKLVVPELASRLTGRAWTLTPGLDYAKFSSRSGVKYFLEFFRSKLCQAAVPWIGRLRPNRSQSLCFLAARQVDVWEGTLQQTHLRMDELKEPKNLD